jgi:nucleotide-binding universal stress UspA family protein
MIFTDYSSKTLAATIDHLGEDDLLHSILVPVDFSDCADNAIRHAVAIALRTGAKIKLFHSVQLPLQTAEMTSFPMDQLEREAARRLGDKCVEITTWLDRERFRKIEVSHQVHIGFAGEEIVNEATRSGCDLIVMGTSGAGALTGMILGSNASTVLQGVKCPVLVVPEDAEFEGFKRIVYASDMKEVNRPAVKMLVDFAKHFDSELHVLHVLGAKDLLTPEQANSFRDQFLKAAHYDKVSFHILDAEDDTIVHTIDEYMDSNDVEVVAMLTHSRSFFDKLFHPSLTKRFAVHAHKPLLAFH